MSEKRICVFFGHRTIPQNLTPALEQAIRRAIVEYHVKTFWCGGYGAFDSLAARTVHRMKAEFPDIELLLVRAYLPREGETMLSVYDDSLYPDGLETVPYRFAISRRNQWMAKHCDVVISYIENSFGGAYQACRAAQRAGKCILPLAKRFG